MQKYFYTAKDDKGKITKDIVNASSPYEAVTILKESGLSLVSLSLAAVSRAAGAGGGEDKKKKKNGGMARGVTNEELAVFCRQVSVSLNSGLSIIEIVRSIAEDMDNEYFKYALNEMIREISNGSSLSQSMSKHKKIFNDIFVALINSAEESGSMPQVFEYLSSFLEKNVRLERKIRSINAYPLFVFIFLFAVICVISIFILPRFENIFSGFHARLPFLTQVIFAINRLIINNIALIAAGIFGIIFGLISYSRTPAGCRNIDAIKLKIPVFGDMLKKMSISRLCRILSLMVRGGVSIESALEISAGVCGNKVLEGALECSKKEVIAGSNFAGSLAKAENFPCLLVRMVNVGEASGRLPQVLDKIADMYEEDVEGKLSVATSLFEPVVIVVFGGVILVTVLAIYVPIFSIAGKIH